MKRLIPSILLVLLVHVVLAQTVPSINGLSKKFAVPGDSIVITGTGFPTSAANTKVTFGTGVASNLISVTANKIVVIVPTTASYGLVQVTNTTSRKSGASAQYFFPAFGGPAAFDVTKLENQVNTLTGGNESYDLCSCDLDGDGRIDFAVSNASSQVVSFMRNTSTINSTSFVANTPPFSLGFSTESSTCGDLNGDGVPELIFVNNVGSDASHVFILQNNSTVGNISFSLLTSFRLPNQSGGGNRNPRRVHIADMDRDGVKDIIVGNDTDNSIFIYRNTSSTNAITLAPVYAFSVTGLSGAGTFEVVDLNRDGATDLVVTAREASSVFALVKNKSIPGTLDFEVVSTLGNPQNRTDLKLGDFNLDGFIDLAATKRGANLIDIYAGTDNAFGFNSTPVSKSAPTPWGLTVTDVNGDGLPDLVAASITNGVDILINSSNGTIAFNDAVKKTTSLTTRFIIGADINNDGKPDLAFTHDVSGGAASDLSVMTNRNCVTPVIGPDPTSLNFCFGVPFDLTAAPITSGSYLWTSPTPSIIVSGSTTQTATLNVPASAGATITIQLTVTAADASGCSVQTTQNYTIVGETVPDPPSLTLSPAGVICAGDDIIFTGPAGNANYFWTSPDGTETITTTNTFTINSATANEAGTYELKVQPAGGCISPTKTITVSIDEPPLTTVINQGDDVFCATVGTTLETPAMSGFIYQWRRDGTPVGTSQTTLAVTESGNYTVALISSNNCENETAAYALTAVAEPVASFTAATEVCELKEITFTSNSTVEATYNPTYTWDFGDGSATATTATALHTFATTGTFTVSLTVSYTDVATCSNVFTQDILVSSAVNPTITAVGGVLEKCPSDSIRLELPQGFQSYTWSTGDTDYFTYAKTLQTEDVATVTVDAVNAIGCDVTASITVNNFANSRITLTSPEATITNDTIRLTDGLSTVKLQAGNGTGFTWEPAEYISLTSETEVTVFPRNAFTTVTLTGTDNVNNCQTTASVVIVIPEVIPRKSFSPNGDGLGFDCWEILNSSNLQGCELYIFDERGRYVYKGNSPFDNNCAWNGNLDNGTAQVPEGVYYFVLKCENSTNSKTGSILLAR